MKQPTDTERIVTAIALAGGAVMICALSLIFVANNVSEPLPIEQLPTHTLQLPHCHNCGKDAPSGMELQSGETFCQKCYAEEFN